MFEGEKEKLTQFWHELNRVATSRANPIKVFTLSCHGPFYDGTLHAMICTVPTSFSVAISLDRNRTVVPSCCSLLVVVVSTIQVGWQS